MKLALWLNYKYCGRFVWNLNSALAVLGISLAVASLVVSMAVVNGYFNTLKKTVTDAMGHVVVLSHPGHPAGQLVQHLQQSDSRIVASAAFRSVEGVASSSKNISGVLIEGVSPDNKVLNYAARVQKGQFDLRDSQALIGKALAQQLKLKVGDELRVVVPRIKTSRIDIRDDEVRPSLLPLIPSVARLQVSGILDLGRHDYNSRLVVVGLKYFQNFLPPSRDFQGTMGGVRVRLEDADDAMALSDQIVQLGYTSYHWREQNQNLFQAALLEKRILFFILLVLVLAASFNVSSTLYVNVMQRWRDMSVMKVLGAQQKLFQALFSIQALVIAFIGLLWGFVLGKVACWLFMWAQKKFQLLPGQVYKLDYLQTQLAWADVLSISVATVLICWLAALWPAYKGQRMLVVRALNYD